MKVRRLYQLCDCDFCEAVYRTCLLCLAPKRPGAFPTHDDCNWDFVYTASAEERERNEALIVRRMRRRTCKRTGRGWPGRPGGTLPG